MMKTLTAAEKHERGAKMAALIDVRKPGRDWREDAAIIRQSMRYVSRAATLYGRDRVLRELAIVAKDNCCLPEERRAWRDYFRRWLDRRSRHLVPAGLLRDAYTPQDYLAPRLTLAPRV